MRNTIDWLWTLLVRCKRLRQRELPNGGIDAAKSLGSDSGYFSEQSAGDIFRPHTQSNGGYVTAQRPVRGKTAVMTMLLLRKSHM